MKKLFWFTQVVMIGHFSALAQGDRAAHEQVVAVSDSTIDAPFSGGKGNESVFVNFSATVRELNKVWLQWDVDSAEEGDYFIVERSTDGVHFENIGSLRKEGNMNHYELNDLAPPNGSDLYRIKYLGKGGRSFYSRAIPLSLSADVDFKFYPNPVDKLFIIRSEHAVDIQVIDGAGIIRLSKRVQPGVQVINISFLEKGHYVLRVADKESNRIVSHQLLKN
jgi:type IX secretion system substrate protein